MKKFDYDVDGIRAAFEEGQVSHAKFVGIFSKRFVEFCEAELPDKPKTQTEILDEVFDLSGIPPELSQMVQTHYDYVQSNQLVDRARLLTEFEVPSNFSRISKVKTLRHIELTLREACALNAVRKLFTDVNYADYSVSIHDLKPSSFDLDNPQFCNLRVPVTAYYEAFGVTKKNGKFSKRPSDKAFEALKELVKKVHEVEIEYTNDVGNLQRKVMMYPPILLNYDKGERRSRYVTITATPYLLLHLDGYFSTVREDYYPKILEIATGNNLKQVTRLGEYLKVICGNIARTKDHNKASWILKRGVSKMAEILGLDHRLREGRQTTVRNSIMKYLQTFESIGVLSDIKLEGNIFRFKVNREMFTQRKMTK